MMMPQKFLLKLKILKVELLKLNKEKLIVNFNLLLFYPQMFYSEEELVLEILYMKVMINILIDGGKQQINKLDMIKLLYQLKII